MVGESVYAELKIDDPGVCQVAAASEPNRAVCRVSRTALPNDDGLITEEIELEEPATDAEVAATPVDESNNVFRFRRPVEQHCACEIIERHECPVRSARADCGELYLTFYAEELQTVREVVTDLKDACDGVHLQCLYQTGDDASRDLVSVDRELLTDRQREVLRTAHEMGYFAHPKEANAGDVAASLGIATTTFVEHLSTAQAKLLDRVLNE